jgi:hypothetical protein
MQLVEYIGKADFEMIHFSLTLMKDVDYKINSKAFKRFTRLKFDK